MKKLGSTDFNPEKSRETIVVEDIIFKKIQRFV